MPNDPKDNAFSRLSKPAPGLRRTAAPRPAPPDAAPGSGTPERPAGAASSPEQGKKKKKPKKEPNRGNYKGGGIYAFQGRDTKKLIVYVDPDVHQAVKVAAAQRGVTMSEVVGGAMRTGGFGGSPTSSADSEAA
ncbi:hypothetical protein RQM47_16295 [Rubrivirga sp. S365]|uniref:hypothetical protein n=1 Tax=Rubrivirga sp. S365 TaxID=3076080 RepID=UPI0028C9A26C|nr:hypothetical protein [Rubrivirga sp. S365]MDT7858210.1 hypothetical protein [Rubrivirga sp. S365]